MTYSDDLRTWIKFKECIGGIPFLQPHWDAIGEVWDIGWGHVFVEGEERRIISIDEAEELLDWDLWLFDKGVDASVEVELEQHEYDALVAFSYNVGIGAFRRSTMLKRLNAGDFEGAMEAHAEWNKAGGKVIRGLVNRRAAERAMFVNGSYEG